jgi:histidine ammonia-lyase
VKGIIAIEMLVAYRGMLMYGVSGQFIGEAYSIINETVGDIKSDSETTTLIEKISKLIDSKRMLQSIPVNID